MIWDKLCPCGAERLSRAPICPACMSALDGDPDMIAYRLALRRGNWSEQTFRITALLEKAAIMKICQGKAWRGEARLGKAGQG